MVLFEKSKVKSLELWTTDIERGEGGMLHGLLTPHLHCAIDFVYVLHRKFNANIELKIINCLTEAQ